MESLRLVTYNCRGMPRFGKYLYTRHSLQLLFNYYDNDIICLQETWYTKHDLARLNTFHPHFHSRPTEVATIDNRDIIYIYHYIMVTLMGVCPYCGERSMIGSLLLLSLRWTGLRA